MIDFGFGLGLASLILIPWAVWRLIRHRDRTRWWWALPVLPASIVLAVLFHRMVYMAAPDLRVEGFPIPIVVFEDAGDGHWRDYFSWFSFYAVFANPLIGLGLPLVPLAILTYFTKKREEEA